MFIKDNRIPSFAPRRFFRTNFSKLSLFILVYLSLSVSLCLLYAYSMPESLARLEEKTLGARTQSKSANVGYFVISPSPTIAPVSPTQTPSPAISLEPTPTPAPEAKFLDNPSQYTAEQIGENTFRVTGVELDNSMATANQILDSLNSYRNSKGVGQLSWDSQLGNLAQNRADSFKGNDGLDNHAGFRSYMDGGGFEKSGFNGLGENSAHLAGPMNGESIIKEIFGADAPHDLNQLDPSWTHAGVGINGNYININFGKNKR